MSDPFDEQKRQVAALYSRAAPEYGRVGPDWFSRLGRRVVELIGIGVGAQALDVAAGRGASLFAAAEKVGHAGHVTGIDLAQRMVEETNADIHSRGLQHATMLQMDAERLEFPSGIFDYVLCGFALFWFPNVERALAEFLRVLRPRGKLGVTVARDTDELSRWYGQHITAYHDRYDFPLSPLAESRHLDLSAIAALLARAGYCDVREIVENEDVVYVDEQEWWASRWSHGPRYSLEQMPSQVAEQFKAEVFAKLASVKRPDGVHEALQVSYIFGSKPALTVAD